MPRFYFFIITILFFSQCNRPKDLGAEKRSVEEISEELLISPNDTVLLELRRNMSLENGDWSSAILDQEQMFYLDTTKPVRRLELAQLYFNYLDSNSSYFFKSYQLLQDFDFDFAPVYLLKGKQHFLIKNYEQSFNYLDRYLRQVPTDYEGYYYKGLVLKEIGDIQRATSLFQTAVEQNPNHIESYIELGHIYSAQGDSLAQYYYENAIREDSTNIGSWYNLGMYFQNQQQYSKAAKIYDRILDIDSNDIDANFNLGYIYLKGNKLASSVEYFERVIVLDSNYSKAYFAKGLALKLSGKYDLAKQCFEKTLELDNNFAEARTELSGLK